LRLDEKFVPKENGSLYIRPFLYATDEFVGVKPSDNYNFVIFTSPVGPYYAEPVKVKFERKFVRACPGGVGSVKMGGNYALSMLATQHAKHEGYHNVIWLDAHENKYVEECGTMNIFFVIDGKVVTPSSEKGTILDGVTRDSVIVMLQDLHIPFEIRDISTDELIEAHKKGLLQEAFGSGTAASLAPICMIGDTGVQYPLPPMSEWTITPRLQEELEAIRLSKIPDRFSWNFPIS
jgi:branched-chain amino acid aminotransferase